MLEKSFSLSFNVKKPKSKNKGNFPIYLRITVDELEQKFQQTDKLNQIAGILKVNGSTGQRKMQDQ